MIGKSLSHFRVLDKLGEGGMGVVYRAEDEKLGRNVALKVLRADAVGNEERRLRFIREARTAASISHPHIATVHEIDEIEDGTVFIAMELVEGQTLAKLIENGPLPLRDTLRFGIEIVEALARAHEATIVHRDLKPDNVIVRPDRHVKILDFGLAKLREERRPRRSKKTSAADKTLSMDMTREGRVMGTANYMSPEQARGLDVDARSDLFAFGILLYEMCTGKKPFESETITDTLSAITRDAPTPPGEVNPDVPIELQRIIFNCLEKDPKERYQHADDIAVDLRRLRRDSDSQTIPSDSFTGPQPIVRAPHTGWKRIAMVAGGLAVLAVAVVGVTRLTGRNAAAPGRNSLAVMPLQNLSDSADDEQLGRILQELIITDLSGADSLRVYSSQRLYDIRKQIEGGDRGIIDSGVASDVARRAGAETMLTGSLSQLGENWILTAQLVDVGDGSVIKSERIDGSDLYAMVDDLTGRIRTDLGMTADEEVTMASVREKTTESIEAYRHYLDGVAQLNLGRREEAVEELQKAVEIDPSFGQAHIKLAVASWWWAGDRKPGSTGDPTSPLVVLEKLLSGNIKLTAKERRTAEALLPLVAYRYEEAGPLFEQLVRDYPDDKEAWYGLGEARRHSPNGHKDPEAQVAFLKALKLDPTFGIAYVHVGEYYALQDQNDEAITTLNDLIERSPDPTAWNVELTLWLMRKEQTVEALALLDRTLEQMEQPVDQVDALLGLVERFAEKEDRDAARQLLDRAATLDVEERRARVQAGYGWLDVMEGNPIDAEPHFRDAIEIDPRERGAINGLFEVLWQTGRYDDAVGEARKLIDSGVDYQGHYRFWIISAFMAGDQQEVKSSIDRAMADAQAANEQRWVWLNAADGASKVGNVELEREYLDRANELTEDPDDIQMLMRRGFNALNRRDHATALEYFEQGNERYGDAQDILFGLAQIHFDLGDFDRSAEYARQLNELNPNSSSAWRWLIAARYFSGDQQGAAELFEQALESLESDFERRELHWEVAAIYEADKRWDEAVRLARRGVELGPGRSHEEALQSLGFALAQRGNYDEAEAALQEALELEPGNWALSTSLAAVKLQRGQAAEAERMLREILEGGPDHRNVHRVLAYALAAQGKYREAESEARLAFEMCPTYPATTALAWVLIEGELDVDEGIELARRAREIPRTLWERGPGAYQASPEHALGLAYIKQGNHAEAAKMLELAAADRPHRALVQQHLEQARSRL